MQHIFSTLSNDNEYVRFNEHGPKGINVAERSVLIKGGAGINKKYLQTPLGVHTVIEDDDYEWLKENYSFKQHMQNGYITIRKAQVNPEVAAAEMATRQWVKDANGNVVRGDSFPVSPQDFSEKDLGNGLTSIKVSTSKKTKAA